LGGADGRVYADFGAPAALPVRAGRGADAVDDRRARLFGRLRPPVGAAAVTAAADTPLRSATSLAGSEGRWDTAGGPRHPATAAGVAAAGAPPPDGGDRFEGKEPGGSGTCASAGGMGGGCASRQRPPRSAAEPPPSAAATAMRQPR